MTCIRSLATSIVILVGCGGSGTSPPTPTGPSPDVRDVSASPSDAHSDTDDDAPDLHDGADGLADAGGHDVIAKDVPGEFPACQPDCEGRQCGDDGCGGVCGVCENLLDRCTDGVCECSLSCPKGLCGVDSCGRYCACAEGKICTLDNECIQAAPQCDEHGFCLIPAATFLMGDDRVPPDGELIPGLDMHVPAHPVTITRPFRIQRTEVTQAAWLELMGGPNPSQAEACGGACPVTRVTFFDALRYANAMSARDGLAPCYDLEGCGVAENGVSTECERATYVGAACVGYRIPSEAEWELAARGGTTGCFPGGDLAILDDHCVAVPEIDPYGWYCANSFATYDGALECTGHEGKTCGLQPVGTKLANSFGLHDMHGNARELVATLLEPYPAAAEVDPGVDLVFELGKAGVSRNGTYSSGAALLCSFWRAGPGLNYKSVKGGTQGFRLAQSVPHTPR